MKYPDDFINKIILGDCLDIMKDIPDSSINLIITDPPYGIDYQSNRQAIDRKRSNQRKGDVNIRQKYFSKIKNDVEVPVEWIKESFRVLKGNSALYVFCRWDKIQKIIDYAESVGFKTKNFIILRKSNHGMGDLKGQYAPTYEGLLYFSKDRHILHKRLNDVIDVPVKFSGSIRLHPNEKPESWFMPFIENSSEIKDTILDPFVGSGTMAMVFKNLDRKFIGIEKDEKYYQVACERIGQKPNIEVSNEGVEWEAWK